MCVVNKVIIIMNDTKRLPYKISFFYFYIIKNNQYQVKFQCSTTLPINLFHKLNIWFWTPF